MHSFSRCSQEKVGIVLKWGSELIMQDICAYIWSLVDSGSPAFEVKTKCPTDLRKTNLASWLEVLFIIILCYFCV